MIVGQDGEVNRLRPALGTSNDKNSMRRVAVIPWLAVPCSSNNIQGYTWDQIEKDDDRFVEHNPGEIDGVKLLGRQTEPAAPKPMQPIVSQRRQQKPDQ
jgi:hypothetical protein